METFVISIKEKYIINHQEQWPRCRSKKLFNLDLVEFEGEVAGYFAKHQRGKDDETIKRTPLTYDDLFKTENGKSKVKRILVEGDAGIGKTTLCTSVSEDWAKGKLFQQFTLLLFLPLRQKKVSSAGSLPELLNQLHHSSEICTSVSSYLEENEGKEVLIIADGWDEISNTERKDGSFLYELILGDLLPFVSILLTSRPTATSEIYDNPYIDQFVEILGFNRKNIREYIRSEFSNDQERADKLLDHLETNALVESICIVPLNCDIICRLWRTCKTALPSTMTDLYTYIILNIIYRNIKKQPGYNDKKIKMWKSFESLKSTSEDLGESWLLLCKFAYQAMEMDQINFSQEDLNVHFPRGHEEILCFGLVQPGESCLDRVSFNFLHLTFQEYLAALHLAQQSPESQLEICRLHAESQRFTIVWRFFFGISFKLIKPQTIGSIITQLVGILDQAPFFRVLCHCAFEANDRNINLLVAERFNWEYWNSFPHNAHDCAAAVSVMANIPECSEMEINFGGCGLHDKHLVHLSNVLACKHGKLKVRRLVLEDNMLTDEGIYSLFLEATAAFQSLKELLLDGNRIGAEGISTVLEEIPSGLTKLWLSDNPLGVSGLHELENAICIGRLAHLRELRLNRCLTSTDTDSHGEALAALAESLSVHCRNLRFLTLSRNNLDESGLQALGKALPQLAQHQEGLHIHLNKTMFNDEGIKALTEVLEGKCHVTEVELKDNGIHNKGISHLAYSMQSGKLAIRSLRLSGNPFLSEGALVIGKMLSNTNCCQFLNLSKCQLAEGKSDVSRNIGQHLCQLPQNHTLQQLILDENCFTGDCIQVLVGFIHLCPNMRFLLCKNVASLQMI